MIFADFQASMPFLIIALAVLAFFGNNFDLFLVVVGLYGWEAYARLTRSLVLQATARAMPSRSVRSASIRCASMLGTSCRTSLAC